MLRFVIPLFVLALATCVGPAESRQQHYDNRYCWNIDGCPHHYRRHVRRDYSYDRDVRFYRTPDREEEPHGGKCLDPVRGLGTQWIGTEGALQAAQKDWMERVRYDHGESFIDMGNAVDFVSRCGRVSIGEVVGQVTYRCEIVARPCKPDYEEGEGKTK